MQKIRVVDDMHLRISPLTFQYLFFSLYYRVTAVLWFIYEYKEMYAVISSQWKKYRDGQVSPTR